MAFDNHSHTYEGIFFYVSRMYTDVIMFQELVELNMKPVQMGQRPYTVHKKYCKYDDNETTKISFYIQRLN